MSVIQLSQNLPPKFHPHILGSQNNPDLYQRVSQAFSQSSLRSFSSSKPYVMTSAQLPGYIIKGKRTGSLGAQLTATCTQLGRADDMHIYRVRKAAKIQRLIEYYGFQDHVAVPQKYLFWDQRSSQWYVIAEKMDLAQDLPKLTEEYLTETKQSGGLLSDEIRDLVYNTTKMRREMTAGQVRALATLAMEAGYTDTNITNIAFTEEGKLAIIDTEPVKRVFKKIVKGSFLFRYGLFDFYPVKFQAFALSTSLMRLVKMPAEAEQALRRVENYYLAKSLVRITIRVATLIFAWSYANVIPIMLAPFLVKATVVLLLLHTAALTVGCFAALNNSRSGFQGLLQLREQEKLGAH